MDIQYLTQCESIASHANKRVAELEQEVKELKEQIRQMQEPKTGHWINITKQNLNDYRTGNRLCFECDQCHHQFTYSSNFCPNCGCRMKGEQECQE